MLESPTHSDDGLLRLIEDGDERAFTALYRRHQGSVYRFALQMSGKTEIAEEVTQEVFFFLIRNLKQYDPARGLLASYLLGVARNFVFRCFERDRAYVTVIDDPENEHVDRIVDTRDLLSDLTRNERIEGLRKAVLALPPNYREVVVLCDLHELDYTEAAEILQCAVGTIRSRLHRARTLLMEKMRAGERCSA